MTDENQPVDEPVSTGLTARVADSYGTDPHEHKPSQDPFDPETADEKQAETGGAPWPGSSSSTSESDNGSSTEKNPNSDSAPARTTESRTSPDPTESSTARSTGTGRRAK